MRRQFDTSSLIDSRQSRGYIIMFIQTQTYIVESEIRFPVKKGHTPLSYFILIIPVYWLTPTLVDTRFNLTEYQKMLLINLFLNQLWLS